MPLYCLAFAVTGCLKCYLHCASLNGFKIVSPGCLCYVGMRKFVGKSSFIFCLYCLKEIITQSRDKVYAYSTTQLSHSSWLSRVIAVLYVMSTYTLALRIIWV